MKGNEEEGKGGNEEGSEGGNKGEEGKENNDGSKKGDSKGDEVPKLLDLPPVLTRADFMEKYNFRDEGHLPNHLMKWKGKPFDNIQCGKLFGEVVGRKRCYGYN